MTVDEQRQMTLREIEQQIREIRQRQEVSFGYLASKGLFCNSVYHVERSENYSFSTLFKYVYYLNARIQADGQEVSSIEEASKKLLEMTEIDALWLKVLDLCGFEYRQPTSAQKKMLSRWRTDFSDEMIAFACNTMKKYTDEDRQSVKAVDNILKDWKRKKFTTPDEVKAQPEKEKKKPAGKGKLKTKPSFDIEEIKKRSALNDDFDI